MKLQDDRVISLHELWVDQETRIAHWMLRITNNVAASTPYELTIPLHPHGLETDRTWDASGTSGVVGVVASGTGAVSMTGTLPYPGTITVRGQSTIQAPTTNPFAMTVTAELDLDGTIYSAFATFKLGNDNVGGLDRQNGWVNQEQIRQAFFEPIPTDDQPTLDLIENRLLRLATLSLLGGTGTDGSGYNPDDLTLKRTLDGVDYAHFVNMIKSAYDGDPRVIYAYTAAKSVLGYDWEADEPFNYTLMSAWEAWSPTFNQNGAVTRTLTDNVSRNVLGDAEARAKLTLTSDGTAGAAKPTISLPYAGYARTEVIGTWARTGTTEDSGIIRKTGASTAELWRPSGVAWTLAPFLATDVLELTLKYELAA